MPDSLGELARLYGVQTSYQDVDRRTCRARPEAVLAVLKALGAPIATRADCPQAIRWWRQSLGQALMPPVTVAWEGCRPVVDLRLAASEAGRAGGAFHGVLETEDGQRIEWTGRVADLPTRSARAVEGLRYLVKRLSPPAELPWPIFDSANL